MKTVVIFCADLRFPGETFEKESYWEAYSDLLLQLQAKGVRAYFATDNATYLGNGMFSEAFTMSERVRPEQMTREEMVHADLVYDRGAFAADDIPVMNPKEMAQLGGDKTLMYYIFSKFQPFSATCNDREELEHALDQIETDLVVVKDPTGFGGSGVHIGKRDEVLAKLEGASYPLLAQEFMDTSVGIPGVVEGVHDLRIEMINGKAAACYVRSPKEGELRANVALGGSAQYLDPHEIPARAIYLSKRIDAYFRGLPRHYAIDFARTTTGWKLIELNAYPGLTPISFGTANAHIMNMLTNYIVKLTRGKRNWLRLPSLNLPKLGAEEPSGAETAS